MKFILLICVAAILCGIIGQAIQTFGLYIGFIAQCWAAAWPYYLSIIFGAIGAAIAAQILD